MFARTDRLLLRPGWTEDRPAVARLLAAGNDTPMAPQVQKRDTTGIELPWILIQRRTSDAPELVGYAELTPAEHGTFALRLWITPHARGFGLATEAAAALVDMARFAKGARRLVTTVTRCDDAAIRLCRRLEMTPAHHLADAGAILFHRHFDTRPREDAPLAA